MQSIKKNVIYNSIYQVFNLITPLITAPYISRVLGADGVGVYSFVSSVMAYFLLVAALGTASYGQREIARHRDDIEATSKLFWEIEILTVFTTLVCLGVWLSVVIFGGDYSYYYAALIPSLLATLFNISWFFIGQERVKEITFVNVMVKLIGIMCLFLFVRERDDLTLYIFMQSMVTMLGNLSMWLYLPGHIKRPKLRTLQYKRHLKETMIYFIPAISTSVYTVLDKTLIGIITGSNYENGYYEQTTKIIHMVQALVFTSVNLVMGARISYLFAQGKEQEIKDKIKSSLDYIMLLGYACVFGLIGIANRFVPWFLGTGYEPVINYIRIMAPIILIIGVSNCLGTQYYTPSGRRKFSAKIIVAAACVNLCLNLCLIPIWKGSGAIVASLIAETFITVLYVRFSNGFMSFINIWRVSYRRIIAGIGMLIIVILLDNILKILDSVVVFMQVCCGAGVYFTILILLKDKLLLHFIDGIMRKFKKAISLNKENT